MTLGKLGSRLKSSAGLLLAGTLLIVLALGACGADPTATPTPTLAPTSAPTPAPFPLVVTDSNGNAVTFEKAPERVIAYDSAAVEILYVIGEDQRIAAAHEFATFPPEVGEIPKVGSSFNINLEKIVELEPDLIYTFYGSSVPELESLGIKVLYLETPRDLAGISAQIRMWGQITGNPDAAEVEAEKFELRVKEMVDRVASVEEGPRVFHDDSGFFTRGTETLVGRIYAMLKAANIAHDVADGLYGQLSPEIIVARDPEIIITTFPDRPRELKENPAFKNVSAVVQDRVYAVDADLISVAGPRFVEAIEELARLIHPDIFQ